MVVYYSATGSTAKIAGAIYRGINSIMECDIAPINRIDPRDMHVYGMFRADYFKSWAEAEERPQMPKFGPLVPSDEQ